MPWSSQSKFTAWLQNIVSHRREESGLYAEIAGHLPLEGPVQLNKGSLEHGSNVGLGLYIRNDLLELTRISGFWEKSTVDNVSLLNIPIFVCIHLWKPYRLSAD